MRAVTRRTHGATVVGGSSYCCHGHAVPALIPRARQLAPRVHRLSWLPDARKETTQQCKATAVMAISCATAVSTSQDQANQVSWPDWSQQQQQQLATVLWQTAKPWQRRRRQPQQQRHQSEAVQLYCPPTATAAEPGAVDALNLLLNSSSISEPYIPADTAAGRNRQLTVHIARRRHWTQLQQVWLDNSNTLSPIHLTAMMTKLARLVELQGVRPSDRPELFKFSGAVISSVGQTVDCFDPRGTAQCLWAYARLQHLSPHSSRTGDAAAAALAGKLAAQHMQQLNAQELSQAAWAIAVLQPAGLLLPCSWWPGFEQRLLLLLPLGTQPSEVACCAWAAAKTGHRPSDSVIQAVMQHAVSTAGYRARELAQIITAAAAWGVTSQEPWSQVLSSRIQLLSPGMEPLEISVLLIALARLPAAAAAAIPADLVADLLQQLQQQLPSSCPRVLVSVPYALAKLNHNPGPKFWACHLPYTAASLHCCNASGLAILAWSLGRLGVNANRGWVQEFVVQSGYKLQGFGPQELSMLVWGLGKWGSEVSQDWWSGAFEQISIEQMDNFTAAELAAMLYGIAGTTAPSNCPPSAAAAGEQGSLTWQGASDLQQQRQQSYTFSKPWTMKLLAAAEINLSQAPASCLSGLLSGLAKLSIRPSSSWLATFEEAAVTAAPEALLSELAGILWAYAVLEIQPSSLLLQSVYRRVEQLLQGLLPQQQQQQWEGSGRCRGTSSTLNPSSSSSSSSSSGGGSSGISAAAATQLIWAVAHLPNQIGAPWIDDLLQAVRPMLCYTSSNTLVTMLRALGRLGHAPGCRTWLDAWWVAYAGHLLKLPHMRTHGNNSSRSAGRCSSSSKKHRRQQRQQLYQGEDYSHPCGQVAAVLWSFGRMRAFPCSPVVVASGVHWLQLLLDVCQPLLCTASVIQLWGVLSQLVHLHVWPGDEWLADAADALLAHKALHQQQCATRCSQQQQQQQQLDSSALQKALRHLARLGCLVVR